MGDYYYSLRISTTDNSQMPIIDEILGVKSNGPVDWELEVIVKENDPPIDFITKFLSILDGKYEALEQIGIQRDDISIWMIYAYDGQCNMEFSPEEMQCLGNEGIELCISCYDTHDYDSDEVE